MHLTGGVGGVVWMNLLIPEGQLMVECAYKFTGHFSTKDQKRRKENS